MSKPSKFKKLTLIILFTALYSTSAFVSGFHAIEFFSLANPFWLALLLAITFEVGQATVLFYLLQGHQNQSSKNKLNNFGKYGPWILMTVLTLTQCIGNIYSSHRYMVTRSTDNIKYFTDSVLFFIKDPDPQVNIVFIDYIVGFLLPIVALAMTSMVVEVLKGAKPAGNQADIVKQAQVMQQQMLEIQEELKSKEVSSSVGGGAVSVKVNGQKELVEVKLSDEIVKEAATDKEMLEDLILTAVKNAMAEAEEMAEKEMAKVTGGINIPGLF